MRRAERHSSGRSLDDASRRPQAGPVPDQENRPGVFPRDGAGNGLVALAGGEVNRLNRAENPAGDESDEVASAENGGPRNNGNGDARGGEAAAEDGGAADEVGNVPATPERDVPFAPPTPPRTGTPVSMPRHSPPRALGTVEQSPQGTSREGHGTKRRRDSASTHPTGRNKAMRIRAHPEFPSPEPQVQGHQEDVRDEQVDQTQGLREELDRKKRDRERRREKMRETIAKPAKAMAEDCRKVQKRRKRNKQQEGRKSSPDEK